MKPIQLHPLSMLTGGGAVLLALVALGQSQVPVHGLQDPESLLCCKQTVTSVKPKEWFTIDQGTAYTVPAGKLLVVRAVGTSAEDTTGAHWVGSLVRVLADGHVEVTALAKKVDSLGYGGGSTMTEIPELFTIAAGTVVEVISDSIFTTDARIWGYLAED